MQQLKEIHNIQFEKIHIVGGGTQNKLLNQLTADATEMPVITGPVEATVIGNIVMQAIGLGHLESLTDARRIIRQSFQMESYMPKETSIWDQQYDRFLKIKTV